MKNVISALVALSMVAGCDAKHEVSLMCDDNDAYGYTSEGNLGPWLMTSSGPMIGDRTGKVTGQPIQCGEAKKLFNVENVVEMRTIQVEQCFPESDKECVGIDFEALHKAAESGELTAPAVIRVEAFSGDKPAHKVENVKSTRNQDGTTTVVALLTYSDGQQENCTFVMVAEPAEKDGARGLNVTPKSRVCTLALKAN